MPSKSTPTGGRRIQMRRSAVHGNGVFAAQDLAAGETLVEYKGEVIDWPEALRRHPHDPSQPNHTFYFHVDDEHVIDGGVKGNVARWINHSCNPNCEADEQDGRIFIKALRNIPAGQELSYDYGLIIDEDEYTPELLAEFPCWCGAETCRGTLLSPREDDEKKKKKKKKKKAKAKARDKAAQKSAGKSADTKKKPKKKKD